MIIKELNIENYRNFTKFKIELRQSTLIIGENNIGKTNLLNALGLIFSNEISFFKKRMLEVDDINHDAVRKFKKDIAAGVIEVDNIEFPEVRVEVIMQDFNKDQEAVVGDWFIDENFTLAKLTYVFQKKKDLSDWTTEQRKKVQTLSKNKKESEEEYNERKIDFVDFPLKFYDHIIYGGSDSTKRADPYFLKMLKMEFLDALRDAKKELIASGDYRLLYRILNNREENKFEDLKEKLKELQDKIRENKELNSIKNEIADYLKKISLEEVEENNTVQFEFSKIEQTELLKKISLVYGNEPVNVERNGLGRNNLLYISLILSHLTGLGSSNNVFYRLIGLEEPEAHLHPHLQEHLARNVESEANESLQLLITSHSTHITSNLDIDNTVILFRDNNSKEIKSHYILSGFKDTNGKIKAEDLKTIKYLKRYLDATKSTLFFARKIILVEGISEQILIPKLFEMHTYKTLEKIGCNIVNVNGVAFKHFLEIIKKGYFIKCLVLTDRDTNTKTEGRADDLKATYEADNNVIKVEISNESTYEKDIINANKEGRGKQILFDALIRTRPENGPKLQDVTGGNSIDIDSFFNEIETRNDTGRKTADFKADFAANVLEVLSKKKENCQNFTIPEYIEKGFEFIYPQVAVTDE
ncbi:MAG TPA: DUF2813 domain-containing protein [Candidatus Moranbacteria bacterium]|nr:DUF2813 domain-containing protein [Candidatus Moranbacteria bacterium]